MEAGKKCRISRRQAMFLRATNQTSFWTLETVIDEHPITTAHVFLFYLQ